MHVEEFELDVNNFWAHCLSIRQRGALWKANKDRLRFQNLFDVGSVRRVDSYNRTPYKRTFSRPHKASQQSSFYGLQYYAIYLIAWILQWQIYFVMRGVYNSTISCPLCLFSLHWLTCSLVCFDKNQALYVRATQPHQMFHRHIWHRYLSRRPGSC